MAALCDAFLKKKMYSSHSLVQTTDLYEKENVPVISGSQAVPLLELPVTGFNLYGKQVFNYPTAPPQGKVSIT